MKTLILMRHSEPDKSTGAPNDRIPLSPRGREKAQAFFCQEDCRAVSRVISSPYLRARETAELSGLPVSEDARLIERQLGHPDTLDKSFWARQYADPDFRNEGGESFREVRQRMNSAVRDVLGALPEGETALVVSHAAAICAWLGQFCTVEVTDAAHKLRRITWEGRVLFDGPFPTPGAFVLRLEDERLADLTFLA